MEIRIYKGEGDSRTLIVKRTRRDELPTRVYRNVTRDGLYDAIKQAVREVAPGTPAEQIPLPSP
jgi:hypothetical protein